MGAHGMFARHVRGDDGGMNANCARATGAPIIGPA